MSFIALFPGQGSQFPGMGKDWVQNFPYAGEWFSAASDQLGRDLRKLCFEGPEAELTKTENTQPCLLLAAYVGFKILERELGFKPGAAAGHSLGEYTALCASGALGFADGLKLTRKRGELMAEAGRSGDGGMMAVIGLTVAEAERLCMEAGADQVLVPANYNAPGQVVISAHVSTLERLQGSLKERKVRGVRLKVSGAFHSPLMQPAATGLAQALKAVKFNDFQFPVISNLAARPYPSPEAAAEILCRQVVSPVRWLESVQYLAGMKPEAFVEIGPGKVLSGLCRKIAPEIPVYNFSEAKDLEALKGVMRT